MIKPGLAQRAKGSEGWAIVVKSLATNSRISKAIPGYAKKPPVMAVAELKCTRLLARSCFVSVGNLSDSLYFFRANRCFGRGKP
jgi:hypothetical protein